MKKTYTLCAIIGFIMQIGLQIWSFIEWTTSDYFNFSIIVFIHHLFWLISFILCLSFFIHLYKCQK